MSTQIPLQRVTEPLLECLDETFSTTHGIYLDKGTSLFATLDEISAVEASQSSAHNTATIAAQVDHVRFYLDVLTEIIRTKEIDKIDWREIWSRVGSVTPDEWDALRQQLKDSHQRVLETLSSLGQWNGEYDIAGTLSILTHTAYHLGGIRQSIAVIRSKIRSNESGT